jgi:hypothetical protein
MKKSSIIDVPRKHDQEDLFGIERYQEALSEFIRNADTPLTIALQGEWGSGKTSLMNALRFSLCDSDKAPFYGIWLNTWQYSLLSTPEQTLIRIIEGLTNKIIEIIKEKHQNKAEAFAKTAMRFFKKASVEIAKIGADKLISGGKDVIGALSSSDEKEILLNDFRDELQKSINELIKYEEEKATGKNGILFFIDDLDRIDPPVAVQILELLKNIFDLENCIFILAIDYDVVIKGLKPKFGELTDKNEREFRSFFDKIIQLPFSMPVASYQIETFLNNALKAINFIDDSEASNSDFTRKLAEFANLSVGSNPRGLKRLTNTLSLISLINKAENEVDTDEDNDEKLINFALVCMQIAYPFVYNNLIQDPDFINWDESKASQMKLKPLSEEQKAQLDATPEFDETWEKVLFQMCQKETYSSNRVFQISQLLNKVKELIPNQESLGDIVGQILELSAVTNLMANDKQKVIKVKSSDYLKVIHDKIIPILKSNITEPFDRVEQKGKRAISNLVLKFTKNDGEPNICYELRPERTKPFIDIGSYMYICKYHNNNIDDSLIESGKNENVSNLIEQFKSSKLELSKKISNIDYWLKPDNPKFYRIVKKEKVFAQVFFRIYFTDINEVITDEFISNLALASSEILKLYRLLHNI